jgi:cytochrome b
MGGWSVAALLLLLTVQVGLGLFAIDVDGVEGGPLSYLVSFETARRISGLHETVFNILLGLTGLHIAAITFYLVYKRENLVAAMLSGYKTWTDQESAPALRFARIELALLGLAGAGLITAWIVGAL